MTVLSLARVVKGGMDGEGNIAHEVQMFDRPEEALENKTPVLHVAVTLKPSRRENPGAWHLLVQRLAALRGIGAGTPSEATKGADLEATVWYDEPEVIRALLEALDQEDHVDSYTVVHVKLPS